MKAKENLIVIKVEGDTFEYRRLPEGIVKKINGLVKEELEYKCCKTTLYFDNSELEGSL